VGPFEYEGLFWRPANEQDKRAGRISFDPKEGGSLSIIGAFGDFRDQFTGTSGQLMIHGVAGRHYLTLLNCFNVETSHDSPGVSRQRYHVNQIITDYLFGENEPLTFDRCSVRLDQLSSWVRQSGVNIEFETTGQTGTADHIVIDFRQPPEAAASIDDTQLKLASTWSLSGNHITETRLDQAIRLEIQYPTAQTLDSVLEDVKHIQDLLTLAVNAAAIPTDITLWRCDIVREIQAGEERPHAMTYHAAVLGESVRLDQPQSPDRVVFEFEDMGGLPTLARWIKVARKYTTVSASLLSIRYAAGLYAENKFSNVISAAESFHRQRFINEVRPKEEFQSFRRSLIKAVPAEHRNWLGNQLQYGNEPRLRARLNEMVLHAGHVFTQVYPEPAIWAEVVTEARNRLTHYDEDRVLELESGDLHFLTESVFVLVMLCLFKECDVPDSTLVRVVRSGQVRFLHARLAGIVPRLHALSERQKR
jgi:hypothetical protein